MRKVNVAIIGTKFMGKAHSHAWSSVSRFFDVGIIPVLKVACGRMTQAETRAFAQRWGWEETAGDWQKVVERSGHRYRRCLHSHLSPQGHRDGSGAERQAHLLREADRHELRRGQGDVRGR